MKIDTLILSGGALKCLSFIGVFEYLFNNEIINKDLKGIKQLICCSGGGLIILPIILGYELSEYKTILHGIKTDTVFSSEEVPSFQFLFENYGCYSNQKLKNYSQVFIRNKGLQENITLKEFYDFKPIELTLKVHNISSCRCEYINYKNYPDMPLVTALTMTSSIPILLEPIMYKGEYYIDGGVDGNLPLEKCESPFYLSIDVTFENKTLQTNDFIQYFINMIRSIGVNTYVNKNRNRYIKIPIDGFIKTNLDKVLIEEFITKGYQICEKHFSTIKVKEKTKYNHKLNKINWLRLSTKLLLFSQDESS